MKKMGNNAMTFKKCEIDYRPQRRKTNIFTWPSVQFRWLIIHKITQVFCKFQVCDILALDKKINRSQFGYI